MSFEVNTTQPFERAAKRLAKRYKSLKMDLADLIASLQTNPMQGTELSPGIRKVRMAISSKGRGKSGGARVITFTVLVKEAEGSIYLIDIYDKGKYSTVDVKTIQRIIRDSELG